MSAIAARPEQIQAAPSGLYWLDGVLRVRRFAPVRPRDLICRLGHEMPVRGQPLTSTPQCDHLHRQGSSRVRCSAHVYLYRLTDLRYLMLDITDVEARQIHRERMDFDDVIAHFHLEMPRIT
jgi:hypothetical protein